jgi:phosphate/sulfate permease
MTVWLWVIVGVAAFLVLSVIIGLVIGAILAQIGREVSELLESELEASASTPLTRERESLDEAPLKQKTSVEHLTGQRGR